MSEQENLRIIITGGAAGLGAAMATTFAKHTNQICVIDTDPIAVETFAKNYPDLRAVVCDACDEDGFGTLVAQLHHDWGGIDVLCANAGTGGPASNIEDIDLGDWQDCLRVNLQGAFVSARAVIPVMKSQKSGLIVFTSSTAGLFGYPKRSPYATAKWGLIGLMKTLAMELGPHGIRVNALAPGAVEGPRMDKVIVNEARANNMDEATMRKVYVNGVSLKSWIRAQDVANMVEFLASPKAEKISGQTLAIDGHTETLAI